MWKVNGKITKLLLFLDSLFPKIEINVRCFLWRQNNLDVNYSPRSDLRWGVFLEETPHDRSYILLKERKR
jgi:hypothetical protein